MKKSKWLTLALLSAGTLLLANGCLTAFGQGLFSTGWPRGNRLFNLAVDVVNGSLLG